MGHSLTCPKTKQTQEPGARPGDLTFSGTACIPDVFCVPQPKVCVASRNMPAGRFFNRNERRYLPTTGTAFAFINLAVSGKQYTAPTANK